MSATPDEAPAGFVVVEEHLSAEQLAENGSASIEDPDKR